MNYMQTIIDDFSAYFMVKYEQIKKIAGDEDDEGTNSASKKKQEMKVTA